MPLPAEFSMRVNHLSDASEARRQVRNLAAQFGFQVLCSDGVDASRIGKVFPGIEQASASNMAQQLLYKLARNDDDATVL